MPARQKRVTPSCQEMPSDTREPRPRHQRSGAGYGNGFRQEQLQLKGKSESGQEACQAVEDATSGAGAALPFIDEMEAAFGQSLSDVQVFTGQPHLGQIGAQGAAAGAQLVFAETSPDMHLVAHELAHFFQQREGVSLQDGLGRAGDRYEQEADAIADRVCRGERVADRFSGGQERSDEEIQLSPGQPEPAAFSLAEWDSGVAAIHDFLGEIQTFTSRHYANYAAALQNVQTHLSMSSAAEAQAAESAIAVGIKTTGGKLIQKVLKRIPVPGLTDLVDVISSVQGAVKKQKGNTRSRDFLVRTRRDIAAMATDVEKSLIDSEKAFITTYRQCTGSERGSGDKRTATGQKASFLQAMKSWQGAASQVPGVAAFERELWQGWMNTPTTDGFDETDSQNATLRVAFPLNADWEKVERVWVEGPDSKRATEGVRSMMDKLNLKVSDLKVHKELFQRMNVGAGGGGVRVAVDEDNSYLSQTYAGKGRIRVSPEDCKRGIAQLSKLDASSLKAQ